MSLKPFTYPFPETRFFHAGSNVYKFKIRYGNSIRGEDIENKEAIVQELEMPLRGKAAGAMMKKRKHVDVPNCPSRQGWTGQANMVTSSQSPSKKKPPVETARVSAKMEASRLLAVATLLQDRIPVTSTSWSTGKEKTQQECQETPAFDITDVQEQDSKWEDSLAGQIIPPLQQTNPPPAKGPTELGTRGFFGFLSSLFPFRYLLRRSSQ
ncbi:membrane-anchored junction protein [Rhinolophus ferrumequinum]|uniref:membrane-anchored junction protein n=1 Tax=Rhinolophus ferrumequinum TaxID=59479 RepID=UPI00140FFA1A|nr:membrane-anchored junction protein [Rhinolophus ferrumequinum]